MSIDAARVTVESPASEVLLLPYNGTEARYSGSFSSLVSGDYVVRAVSNAGSISLSIPHSALTSKPELTSIVDGNGNSAFFADILNGSSAISIGWEAVAGCSVYRMELVTDGTVAEVFTTDATGCVVEADTFSSGEYSASVVAQYLAGDPFLTSDPYYSVSSERSASVYFEVTVP